MSHVDTSPLSMYNSLSDPHLAGYFANTKMRNHLRRSGLISRRGQIVSENSYRLSMARKEHKKHVKDLLAQAIVHKTLDLERNRQVAIRQKLEEIAKLELVQRVKGERYQDKYQQALLPLLTPRKERGRGRERGRDQGGSHSADGQVSQRSVTIHTPHESDEEIIFEERTQRQRRNDEDLLPYLSPRSSRPHSGPEPHSHRSKSSSKYRPISAPSNMPDTNSSMYDSNDEADITYVDDDGNPIEWPESGRGRSRTPRSREEIDARHLYSLNPAALRRYATTLARMEQTNALVSPYLMPQVPIPPSSPRTAPSRLRGHRARSTSSDKSPKRSPGRDLHRQEPPMRHQGDVHSMCQVKMKYHGWALNLARETRDPRQEVLVEQQHCGGNTLVVYRDLLVPGSTFTFTSKRHRGYPFSLTLYVDGRQDCRVSTCCEYGHSKKVRLGSKMGHFSIINMGGASPCYKCQVKRGMKGGKPAPRKQKAAKEDTGEEVIVMDTVAKEKKEKEETEEEESETAEEQIMVAVETEGGEGDKEKAADEYEDDFDDDEEEERKEEDEGDKATTARTNVEVEGQDADEAENSEQHKEKEESKKDTNYTFLTNKQEVTEVEENAQSDFSESVTLNSDSLENLKDKYMKKDKDKKQDKGSSLESSSSSGSSTSSSSSDAKKKKESRTPSYSTNTFQPEDDDISAKQVNAADADTADDVSDIETDVEWPRKSEPATEEKVLDTLPPKPRKKSLQGILSPRREKQQNEKKKKTTFKIDVADIDDDNSGQKDDSSDEEAPEKKRTVKPKKKSPKNYDIGILACNDDEASGGIDHLTVTSDRSKNDDLPSDIPQVSVKKSGVTLFSDRVEEEPCREHVTVGGPAEEEQEDERGTESDEAGDGNVSVERGHHHVDSDGETSVDVVAQYAAHLTDLEDRATTESCPATVKLDKEVDDSTSSHPKTNSESSECTPKQENGLQKEKDEQEKETFEEKPALPSIVVHENEEDNTHQKLSELDDKGLTAGLEENEVTLADIKSGPQGTLSRRVSTGGESLLSVPNSDVQEPGVALWSGPKLAQTKTDFDDKRETNSASGDSTNSVEKQKIPVILVNEGNGDRPGVLSRTPNKVDSGDSMDTDPDSSSSSSSSSSSRSSSRNAVKPSSSSASPLARTDSSPLPTIITEHVD